MQSKRIYMHGGINRYEPTKNLGKDKQKQESGVVYAGK